MTRISHAAATRGRAAGVVVGAPGRIEPVPEVRGRGISYPEWDVRRGVYRPGWCQVVEVDPAPGDPATVVRHLGAGLHRPLARLGLGIERCHRQLQGEDLDVDAVVEERVQLLAGSSPREAVYIENLRRRHDLAVVILLDISGSAAMPTAAGPSVHEQQRSVAAGLAVALHTLGNRVALYGFRSQGRNAVRLIRVKSFDDRLDASMMHRLGALEPGAYTRLGAAIRHGTTIVQQRGGTPRQLLVVVSDGLAYDHGYEGGYAEADARRALSEARITGTGSACLSIAAGNDLTALRRVFGVTAHAVLGRPQDLVKVVGPLLRTALRSPDSRRRLSRSAQRPLPVPRSRRRTA